MISGVLMNKYTLRTKTWHCSQLPLTHNSPQPAHNLLSHKYANHPQLPHAEICHNSSSCWKGQQGSFPHIRHTLHSCFVAHSFILTVPRKNTSQMRGACACPHPAASAATASKGWCSCDPAVTWKDAFTTLCGEQDRIFPVPCLECVRSIPDVARGESQAASCPMSGSRPRDLRQCRSCLGWGKWREA